MSNKSGVSGPDQGQNVTIRFGEKFAESENFSAIFDEGMALVEATAAYLDGEGRRESNNLDQPASLAYATESMRLTTRLMQIASWLLIRRAVNEGELTPKQANEESSKVKLKIEQTSRIVEGYDELPDQLKGLISASLALNRRIIYLDQLLNADKIEASKDNTAPLGDQRARLLAAFGAADGGEIAEIE